MASSQVSGRAETLGHKSERPGAGNPGRSSQAVRGARAEGAGGGATRGRRLTSEAVDLYAATEPSEIAATATMQANTAAYAVNPTIAFTLREPFIVFLRPILVNQLNRPRAGLRAVAAASRPSPPFTNIDKSISKIMQAFFIEER